MSRDSVVPRAEVEMLRVQRSRRFTAGEKRHLLSAVQADESVVPISQVQALLQQVQQLQRLLGKKTAECEILREAVEVGRAKKLAIALARIAGRRDRVATLCRVLGIAWSYVIERRSW